MGKKEKFIEKSNKVHNNKYDYTLVEYINSTTEVEIICPIHGIFKQIPSSHLRGYGCPECGRERQGRKISKDNIISRMKSTHGGKYDYSRVEYINCRTEVEIICPIHGSFKQLPLTHINGQGCPKCAGKNRNTEDIIDLIKGVHGDKYDYSKIVFTKMDEPICLVCPIHGDFFITPNKIIQRGSGCKKCAMEKRIELHRETIGGFIERSNEIHSNFYDYSIVNFISMRDKVDIICPKHGLFSQFPFDHVNGHGCPKCGNNISNAEDEIYSFIVGLLGEDKVVRHNRDLLNGQEIDIYIPELNIAFEYDGLRWHSEEFGKTKYYHLNKTTTLEDKGIRLYHIFEDEYQNKKEIVFNKIKHILGMNSDLPTIYGRKCYIKEISKKDAEVFMEKYHIQGYGKSSINLGSFYNSELIAVMSFLCRENGNYELVRFASNSSYKYAGVGGKLFKTFLALYNPNKIKTFADRRWTNNKEENLYTKLGFICDKVIKPDYYYISKSKSNERIHKFNLRKNIMHKKYNMSLSMTEKEMTEECGFTKVWNCGLYRYIWKKEA